MTGSPITTVLAADNRFSRPLATTVHSIVSHLTPGRALRLYLCDMGITEPNREKIAAAGAHPDVEITWISSLMEKVAHLPQTWPGITRAAYARLLIPALLPDDADRALYLDCDLITRRCIGDLYDVEIGDYAAMGVADACSPFVSSPYGVPYWARYGRRADEVNFNSGVLLMNLKAWRAEDVTAAAFAYLTDGRHQIMVDQEAINAVLPGRIGLLDPRWNQQTEHFLPQFQSTLAYDAETLAKLLDDPWIVHFTTGTKAWTYGCGHQFRDEWFAALDETPYRGWRPTRGAHLVEYGGRKLRAARNRLAASKST